MREFIKENKIILGMMAIIFIACFFVLFNRVSVENNNKTYDIVIDYNEIEKLAEQSGHDVSWWLSEFKDIGITQVGLQEENIMSLMENSYLSVSGEVMYNLKMDVDWMSKYPEEFIENIKEKGFDEFDVMIEARGNDTISLLASNIKERIPEEKYVDFKDGDKYYVLLDGTSDMTLYSEKYKYMNSKNGGFIDRIDVIGSKLMYISLGFSEDKLTKIQSLGMEIVPRTLSYTGWNDTKFAEAVVKGYEKYGINPKYIIVGGEAVFGFDDGIDFAKDYIADNGVTIGLIENTTQLQNILQYGVEEIAQATNYDTVRVFSVWDYIQNRYQYYGYEGAKEIENTLFRAISERNIRVIYFKPIKELKDLHTYVTDIEEYKTMFANLDERLSEHGITRGQASVMEDYHVDTLLKIILGFGCALGAVLLLRCFLPINRKWSFVLSGLGIVGVVGAFFIMPNTSELIASFSAAVVFSCLAITFFTYRAQSCRDQLEQNAKLSKIMIAATGTLVASVLIALFGGMLTAAPICSINYMLEIDIFRGVKLAQLLPIAYFAIAYLSYFGYGDKKRVNGKLEFHDIKDMLDASIKVWMILLGVVVLGVGAYYIMRTGHDSSIEVSSTEMLFRNKLEEMFIARPRTKEFLFAFPCIMLMVYCAVRRFKLWSILFGLGGVIGMTCVVNTFMHIRTPLYLGFIRTGYSLFFGIMTGLVGILLFEALYKLYNRYIKHYFDNETSKDMTKILKDEA